MRRNDAPLFLQPTQKSGRNRAKNHRFRSKMGYWFVGQSCHGAAKMSRERQPRCDSPTRSFRQSVADFPIDLQQPLFVHFDDRAVVGHQAVEFGFAIGGLGVDRR